MKQNVGYSTENAVKELFRINRGQLVFTENKKAFQSNANHPLSDSPCFIVNTFEHVWGGKVEGPCTVRSRLNKFEHFQEASLYGDVEYIMGNGSMRPSPPGQNDRQTDRTENTT